MDSDEEDFVFYGTPIEREEENISRKKKAEAESSGQLRTVVPWKQEVLASLPCFFFSAYLLFLFKWKYVLLLELFQILLSNFSIL